jgi:hypothetical protein
MLQITERTGCRHSASGAQAAPVLVVSHRTAVAQRYVAGLLDIWN